MHSYRGSRRSSWSARTAFCRGSAAHSSVRRLFQAQRTASSSVSTTLFIPAITMISRDRWRQRGFRRRYSPGFSKADGIAPVEEEIGREASWPPAPARHPSACLAVDDATGRPGGPAAGRSGQQRLARRPSQPESPGDQPRAAASAEVRLGSSMHQNAGRRFFSRAARAFHKQRNRFHRYPSVFLSFYRAGAKNAREQIGTTGQQHIK